MTATDAYRLSIERNSSEISRLRALSTNSSTGALHHRDQKELDVRLAIQRFADGTTKTDGEWTVVNLVAETGIPRPTLYRRQDLLEEFQSIAAIAPAADGGMKERLRDLSTKARTETALRRQQDEEHERLRSVLIERLYAMSLAWAAAAGKDGVVDLLNRIPKAPT